MAFYFCFTPPWNSLKIGRNRHATSVSIVEKIKIIKSKQLKASQNQSSFNHHKLISQFKIPSASWCFFQGAGGSWGGAEKSRTITGSQVSIWHILVRKGLFFLRVVPHFQRRKNRKTWSWGNSDLIYVLSRGSLVEKGRASSFRGCFYGGLGENRGEVRFQCQMDWTSKSTKNIGSCVPCRALGEEASFGIGRLPFKEGPGVLVTDVRAGLLSGNHATLMEKKGTYYALVAAQDLQNWIIERFCCAKTDHPTPTRFSNVLLAGIFTPIRRFSREDFYPFWGSYNCQVGWFSHQPQSLQCGKVIDYQKIVHGKPPGFF